MTHPAKVDFVLNILITNKHSIALSHTKRLRNLGMFLSRMYKYPCTFSFG